MSCSILAADFHLAPGAWASRPLIRGDAYYSFQQIVDYAVKHDAADVVAAGDLIDTAKPSSETVRHMCAQLRRLHKAGVSFRFVQGQHDMATPPWFAAVSDVEHVHGKYFTVGDLQAYGLDYLSAAALREALPTIKPGTQLLVCHQVWSDFMGSIAVCEGALSDIPYVTYVLTGDYHKTVIDTFTNRQGKTGRVWSPGSICMQSIDEDPEKYFFHYDHAKRTVKQVLLRTRPLIAWHEIEDEGEMSAFLTTISEHLDKAYDEAAGLPEEIRKPIVHVPYSLDLERPYARILKALDGRAHFFQQELVRQTAEQVIEKKKRQEIAHKGLLGCLPLVVPDEESPVRKGLERLLASKDPAATLRQMKEEFFAD